MQGLSLIESLHLAVSLEADLREDKGVVIRPIRNN
jgi:hypothetical protein